jgi:hypothetical protein
MNISWFPVVSDDITTATKGCKDNRGGYTNATRVPSDSYYINAEIKPQVWQGETLQTRSVCIGACHGE